MTGDKKFQSSIQFLSKSMPYLNKTCKGVPSLDVYSDISAPDVDGFMDLGADQVRGVLGF